MFFRKKEEKVFYPFAYDLADHTSTMLEKEFAEWYKKNENSFSNITFFFYFLKSYPKLFKKCKKEDLSRCFLSGFENPAPEIKKIIDDLSEELCSKGKINRNIDYYMEELSKINGY